MIDHNRRVYPDRPFPPVESSEPVAWSNGICAGAGTMAMGPELAGTWAVWMLDDATVVWIVGIGDLAAHAELADRIATSISYGGDAASLEALFQPHLLEDVCSPLPEA